MNWDALAVIVSVISAFIALYAVVISQRASKKANKIQAEILNVDKRREGREITSEQRKRNEEIAFNQTARLTCSLHPESGTSPAVAAIIANEGPGTAPKITINLSGINYKSEPQIPDTLESSNTLSLALWRQWGSNSLPSVTVSWEHPSGHEDSLVKHLPS